MTDVIPDTGAESPRYVGTTAEDLRAEALASMPQEEPDESPDTQGATETADETAESSDTPADEHEDGGDEKPKPSKGVQKRLDELTREKYEERRRADALQAQLERTIAMLEKQQGQPQQPQADNAPDPNAAPDPDQYPEGENDRQFIRDLARFEARQEIAQQQAIQAKQREIADIQAREQAAREKYEDYQQVVTQEAMAPILQRNPRVIAALATHEKGPDLAYYLAKHPADLSAIAGSSYEAALIRIGQITVAIDAPKDSAATEVRPRISKAPEPIKPIGGGDPPAASFEAKLEALVAKGDFDSWRKLKSSAKR